MISISANLNIMIKAAEKASKSVIRDFGEVEKLQVSKKGPYDFVTKTDKYVEKILIEELSKSKKNYSFITEESGSINNKDTENIWIIDPIDGTTNFLHGVPHFAICIALKSKGPFLDTCNFSTSPKSLIKDLEAFSAALIIIFRFEDIEIIMVIIFLYIQSFLYQ